MERQKRYFDIDAKNMIRKVYEWMRFAFEREKAGLPWQGVDERGKKITNRNKLTAKILGISVNSLCNIRNDAMKTEVKNFLFHILSFKFVKFFAL